MTGLLALLIAATVAAAPYRLVDSVGEPVRGATVRVLAGGRLSAVAVTDAEGRFRLDPEPAAPFEVTVVTPRGAVLGRARVASPSDRLLVLHPVETELVTVRGSPLPATASSPAAASTELSREGLTADRPTLLADALEEVPGASNAGGGHTGVPSLRGMARCRTLVALAAAVGRNVRGFREPTLSDRYFRGVSGRGFVVGNPDLRPERSDQLDLAVRGAFSERARLAAYGYLYRIHDVVERFRDGADFRFRNRGEQEVRGAELEAEWSATDGLDLSAGLSWARGRIVDDDSFAADVPAPAAVLAARYSVTPRLWTRVRARLVAEDDEPGPTEAVTPAHQVVDLSAGFALTERLEVVVAGSNLTDERYPLSADADAPAAPGGGRRGHPAGDVVDQPLRSDPERP